MLLSAQCSNAVPVGKWTSVFFKSSNGFGFRGPSIPRCAKFTRAACTSLNPGPGGNRKYRWFVDIQSSTQAFPFSNRWAKYFKSKDPWAARWWQNHKNQSDHINNFQVQAVVKQISQMAGWTCQFSATYCLLPSSGFWSDRQTGRDTWRLAWAWAFSKNSFMASQSARTIALFDCWVVSAILAASLVRSKWRWMLCESSTRIAKCKIYAREQLFLFSLPFCLRLAKGDELRCSATEKANIFPLKWGKHVSIHYKQEIVLKFNVPRHFEQDFMNRNLDLKT